MTPPLYKIVDFLYNLVMEHMPDAFKERDMASAFTLGFTGTYFTTRLFNSALEKLLDKLNPYFSEALAPRLEKLKKAAVFAPALVFVLYTAIDPDGAKDIMAKHPTYASGMIGVGVGATVAFYRNLKQTYRNLK